MSICQEIAELDQLEVSDRDVQLVAMVLALRSVADTKDVVIIQMPAPAARLLAADLEELVLLRVVPPTGESG